MRIDQVKGKDSFKINSPSLLIRPTPSISMFPTNIRRDMASSSVLFNWERENLLKQTKWEARKGIKLCFCGRCEISCKKEQLLYRNNVFDKRNWTLLCVMIVDGFYKEKIIEILKKLPEITIFQEKLRVHCTQVKGMKWLIGINLRKMDKKNFGGN